MMDDSQLRAELAQANRAAQANGQALSEKVAELAYARPMADAAHTYCAAYLDTPLGSEASVGEAFRLMLDAHRATTSSRVPSSHVIVERAELERLQAIEKAVRRVAHVAPDEAPEAWHDVLVLLGEDT